MNIKRPERCGKAVADPFGAFDVGGGARLAGQQNDLRPVGKFGFHKIANRLTALVVVGAKVRHLLLAVDGAVKGDHRQLRILNFIHRAGDRVHVVRGDDKALRPAGDGVFQVSHLLR